MKKLILLLAVLSVLLWPVNYFSVNRKISLVPQMISEPDYQGRQLILRNTYLYPNVPLARFFQNKAVIITNKYLNNFFDFIDPGYYLFGSHPRELVDGQNYTRLPLFALIPILWFLFKFKNKRKKIFLLILTGLLLILSLFLNHPVYDFLLWPFFLPMIYFGLLDIWQKNKNLGIAASSLLLLEVILELSRVIS